VILMLGTNDSKSYNWMVGTGTRAQQFVTDCTALVDHFAALPTHPLVYLALPSRSFANSYGISGAIIHDQMLPLIQQVAAAKGLPVIDVDTPTATHPELFPDGVHPNDTGSALIAQVMHDALLRPLTVTGQGGTSGTGGRGMGGNGAGGSGAGGRGVGGSGAGGTAVGGSGAGGSGGARADAGEGGAAAGGATGAAGASGDPSGMSGCSCQVPPGHPAESATGLLLLAAVAGIGRRKRSSRSGTV
jgi:MYXO-CTERM domain-containing protein